MVSRQSTPGRGSTRVDAVILAGSIGQDATWTGGCPRPLLPLPGSTLLHALVARLNQTAPASITVCAHGRTDLIANRLRNGAWMNGEPTILEDAIPRGTAGCLRACQSRFESDAILVVGGCVWLDDNPEWMIQQHRSRDNALTVFCSPDEHSPRIGQDSRLRPSGVCCCDRRALDLIRPQGYQDLKEQLIPALQDAGLRVGAVVLPGHTREVVDWAAYMEVLWRVLSADRLSADGYRQLTPDVWCGEGVSIAPTARIVGPAVLGHRCTLESDSVVVGPAILGDGSCAGRGSRLIRVVTTDGVRIPQGRWHVDQVLSTEIAPLPTSVNAGTLTSSPDRTAVQPAERPAIGRRTTWQRPQAYAIGVAAAFIWAFWSTLTELCTTLWNNPDYSAGLIVPPAILYMIHACRERLAELRAQFWPVGAAVFFVGAALNIMGQLFHYSSAANLGLVVAANGVVMGMVGRRIQRQIWFPLACLVLMLPLPYTVREGVLYPLQGFGAKVSASLLETVGIPTEVHGHVLEVVGRRIAVAEACSGLRLILAFLLVTAVVAYVIGRPRWQKVIVLASSIPIAVACNVLRVAMSAFLYYFGYERLAQGVFHDGAGLVMMPLALGLILLEFRLLSSLVMSVPRVELRNPLERPLVT